MNREGVKKLLVALAWEELVRLTAVDRRVLRTILGLLYDADDCVHWLAVDAVGRVGGATAATDPDKVRELIRRLLWALNEESGGTPWGATGAIGAIVAARPDLFANYLSMICPFHDDVSIYPEFIWSLAAVGRSRPDLTAEYGPFVLAASEHGHPSVRSYATWCLGVLRPDGAEAALAARREDAAVAAVYEGDGVYRQRPVGAIAAESLAKIAKLKR